VGKVLEENGYLSFEDPMPTVNIDGLVELHKHLNCPPRWVSSSWTSTTIRLHYRGHGMLVRLIADNIGGITGSFRVATGGPVRHALHAAQLGQRVRLAVHFQLELGAAQLLLVRDAVAWESGGPDYMGINSDDENAMCTPDGARLGYPLNRDVLDKITKALTGSRWMA